MNELETKLNDFNPQVRLAALQEAAKMIADKKIAVAAPGKLHNMHCHTFFSYNGYGYSPSYVAYLAKIKGFYAVGMVDFDVLDGVDEFLHAAELLGLKAICGIESRVFIEELKDVEINSPGEPGIAYHLGYGFKTSSVPAKAAAFAAELKNQANNRTKKLVELVNKFLAPVQIDFAETAKKFTPFGNVTERHVCQAYREKAENFFADPAELAAFWSDRLNLDLTSVNALLENPVKLEGEIRSKTMKRGGVGYVAPTPASFPTLKAMNQFIMDCGAVPTLAWLNGLSAGEARLDELLDLHIRYGAKAATLIPDRNYNVKDAAKREILVKELDRFIAGCQSKNLALLPGTEMNAPGQKLVDDFDEPCLKKHLATFISGVDAALEF